MAKKITAISFMVAIIFCAVFTVHAEKTETKADFKIDFQTIENKEIKDTLSSDDEFYVVLKLKNYDSLVGNADYDNQIFDRAIAFITAYIGYDDGAVEPVVDKNGEYKITTPYEKLNSNDLVMVNAVNGKLGIVAETDNNAGRDFSITKDLLDSNDGELLRVAFKVVGNKADKAEFYVIDNVKDAGSTGIALVNKESKDAKESVSSLGLQISGDKYEVELEGGGLLSFVSGMNTGYKILIAAVIVALCAAVVIVVVKKSRKSKTVG